MKFLINTKKNITPNQRHPFINSAEEFIFLGGITWVFSMFILTESMRTEAAYVLSTLISIIIIIFAFVINRTKQGRS